jgi:hypothetical protein
MDGYLTFKESKKGKIFSTEAWTRQYFVVDGSDLFYYRKKEVSKLKYATSVLSNSSIRIILLILENL